MISKNPIRDKTIYDNARNHFLGNFPDALPIEQAYVHIGIYLGWIIDNDIYSELFKDESEIQIYRFKNRSISCTILSELWDGYLGPELFSKEGNMFTYYYYAGGLYRKDYDEILVKELPSIYHVEDSWENYEAIVSRISEQYDKWKTLVD